jgi:hypothetical protein
MKRFWFFFLEATDASALLEMMVMEASTGLTVNASVTYS